MTTGGPFTRAQALAVGFSPTDVKRHLASGLWVCMRRGVYVEASALAAAARHEQRAHALDAAALMLALDCDAVAGGRSAARIWGIDLLARRREPIVVVTGEVNQRARRGADYVLRSAWLPASHRGRRFGVPVTSVARTVADVARTGTLRDGVVAADSALHAGLVTVEGLQAVLRDCRGWSGLCQASEAIALADPKAESPLESISRVVMHQQGIPAPQTQVRLSDEDGPVGRVDFYWPEFALVGEADGLAQVRGRRADDDRDRAREARLFDLGFEVVRWTWEDAENPARLAQRLRAAFARGLERRRGRRAS